MNYPDNMNWEAYDRIHDPQPEEDYPEKALSFTVPDPEFTKAIKQVERRMRPRAQMITVMPAESAFCEWAKNYRGEIA